MIAAEIPALGNGIRCRKEVCIVFTLRELHINRGVECCTTLGGLLNKEIYALTVVLTGKQDCDATAARYIIHEALLR
jgi:hypothetical protein